MTELEKIAIIAAALARHDGNVSAAARALGVSRGWLLRNYQPAGTRPGRPRKTRADQMIRELGRDGWNGREIAEAIRLAGHDVSPGTVARRLREGKKQR